MLPPRTSTPMTTPSTMKNRVHWSFVCASSEKVAASSPMSSFGPLSESCAARACVGRPCRRGVHDSCCTRVPLTVHCGNAALHDLSLLPSIIVVDMFTLTACLIARLQISNLNLTTVCQRQQFYRTAPNIRDTEVGSTSLHLGNCGAYVEQNTTRDVRRADKGRANNRSCGHVRDRGHKRIDPFGTRRRHHHITSVTEETADHQRAVISAALKSHVSALGITT